MDRNREKKYEREGGKGRERKGKENVQVSRARIVLSSSPTRRIGSTRNLAPSSSPTPISPALFPSGGTTRSVAGVELSGRIMEVVVITAATLREDSAARRRAGRMKRVTVDTAIVSVVCV